MRREEFGINLKRSVDFPEGPDAVTGDHEPAGGGQPRLQSLPAKLRIHVRSRVQDEFLMH